MGVHKSARKAERLCLPMWVPPLVRSPIALALEMIFIAASMQQQQQQPPPPCNITGKLGSCVTHAGATSVGARRAVACPLLRTGVALRAHAHPCAHLPLRLQAHGPCCVHSPCLRVHTPVTYVPLSHMSHVCPCHTCRTCAPVTHVTHDHVSHMSHMCPCRTCAPVTPVTHVTHVTHVPLCMRRPVDPEMLRAELGAMPTDELMRMLEEMGENVQVRTFFIWVCVYVCARVRVHTCRTCLHLPCLATPGMFGTYACLVSPCWAPIQCLRRPRLA